MSCRQCDFQPFRNVPVQPIICKYRTANHIILWFKPKKCCRRLASFFKIEPTCSTRRRVSLAVVSARVLPLEISEVSARPQTHNVKPLMYWHRPMDRRTDSSFPLEKCRRMTRLPLHPFLNSHAACTYDKHHADRTCPDMFPTPILQRSAPWRSAVLVLFLSSTVCVSVSGCAVAGLACLSELEPEITHWQINGLSWPSSLPHVTPCSSNSHRWRPCARTPHDSSAVVFFPPLALRRKRNKTKIPIKY